VRCLSKKKQDIQKRGQENLPINVDMFSEDMVLTKAEEKTESKKAQQHSTSKTTEAKVTKR
jgi:hypothetical protein